MASRNTQLPQGATDNRKPKVSESHYKTFWVMVITCAGMALGLLVTGPINSETVRFHYYR